MTDSRVFKQTRLPWKRLLPLAFAILVMTAVYVKLLQPMKRETVADAQVRLDRVQAEMAATVGVFKLADAAGRAMTGTNSPLSQAIQSVGQGVIQELGIKQNEASVELTLAQTVAAADFCIQTYEAYNQAQQAMATLNLSGIDDAVIHPPGKFNTQRRRSVFELLVPHSLTNEALAALATIPITELNRFGDVTHAAEAVQTLAARGIQATIRPLERMKPRDVTAQDYVVYVRKADFEAGLAAGISSIPGVLTKQPAAKPGDTK